MSHSQSLIQQAEPVPVQDPAVRQEEAVGAELLFSISKHSSILKADLSNPPSVVASLPLLLLLLRLLRRACLARSR
jgi:hypothetical protein